MVWIGESREHIHIRFKKNVNVSEYKRVYLKWGVTHTNEKGEETNLAYKFNKVISFTEGNGKGMFC